MVEVREVLEKTNVFNKEELEGIIGTCLSDIAKKDIELICYYPRLLKYMKNAYDMGSIEDNLIFWRGFFSEYENKDKDLRKPGKEEMLFWSRLDSAAFYYGQVKIGPIEPFRINAPICLAV